MKLIEKDALVAEIKRRINEINLDTIEDWRYRLQWEHDIEVMKNILSFIDTLKVKEIGVDLGDPKGNKSAKHIIDTKTLEVKEVDDEPECMIFPRPIECYSTCKECPWLATNKAQKGEKV